MWYGLPNSYIPELPLATTSVTYVDSIRSLLINIGQDMGLLFAISHWCGQLHELDMTQVDDMLHDGVMGYFELSTC